MRLAVVSVGVLIGVSLIFEGVQSVKVYLEVDLWLVLGRMSEFNE